LAKIDDHVQALLVGIHEGVAAVVRLERGAIPSAADAVSFLHVFDHETPDGR
jgi:hypothetical protein